MTLRSLFRRWLREFLRPDPPGPFYVFMREVEMKKIEVTLAFPSLGATEVGEVVARKVKWGFDGGNMQEEDIPVATMEKKIRGDKGQSLHVEVYNVDDDNNVSVSSSNADIVLADTTPPGAPGPINFTMEEIDVPDDTTPGTPTEPAPEPIV